MLIKPSEGVSYAEILKSLISRVNAEKLGVTIGETKKTRSKDFLFEVKCAAKDRGRLNSAFRDVVGETKSVHHLVPMFEVEILDLDPTAESEEVAETGALQEEPSSEVKVSMTKRPLRGTRKAFVRLEELPALILLKVTHIKIGWVSCRIHQKAECNRCFSGGSPQEEAVRNRGQRPSS